MEFSFLTILSFPESLENMRSFSLVSLRVLISTASQLFSDKSSLELNSFKRQPTSFVVKLMRHWSVLINLNAREIFDNF